ncbi:cyclase family protein [Chloroflexia bacterium SDU3-3]|nr:cyclase family protein [Chloroflexia bacterium SDU3-3]
MSSFSSPHAQQRIFDLEQPRTAAMPIHPAHRPGYSYQLHRRHRDVYGADGTRSSASGMIMCMEHTGTHIDALCHQAHDLTLYGGIAVTPQVETSAGFREHSVDQIAPIVAPGVLLDLPALLGVDALPQCYAISAAELAACCERQALSIAPGDVVLVYTGNELAWGDEARYLDGPGVAGEASVWLADQGVLAVGADNMAWDVLGLVDPALGCTLPGHLIFLAQRGIYIIENMRLRELAAAQAYRFTFVCTPLKFVGATGSPVRPIAIVP